MTCHIGIVHAPRRMKRMRTEEVTPDKWVLRGEPTQFVTEPRKASRDQNGKE